MTTSKKPRHMARQPIIIIEGEGTAPVAADATTRAILPPTAKRPTKQALVLDLLRGEGGASLNTIVAATGWQVHTARAALSGLRKQGQAIARTKVEGEMRYILSDAPAQ